MEVFWAPYFTYISSLYWSISVNNKKTHFCFVYSVSPGNIWTPLWEAGANSSANPEAMIKGGRDAQVKWQKTRTINLISLPLW